MSNNNSMDRNFKGVWIPKEIWESKTLTLQEKVFFVEIDSLDSSERGCYANNHYFADFFGISKTRVSLVIKSLIEKGFITSTINIKEGNKRILKGSLIKVKGGLKQKLIHSNTISNTVSNTIKDINSRETEFENSLQPFLERYGANLLNEFYLYWTEKNTNGKKMKFEMNKTFDVSRRLSRWSKNNFNTGKNGKQEKQEQLREFISNSGTNNPNI
jgi:hypothetical protein